VKSNLSIDKLDAFLDKDFQELVEINENKVLKILCSLKELKKRL
jgi:hypothetical protein